MRVRRVGTGGTGAGLALALVVAVAAPVRAQTPITFSLSDTGSAAFGDLEDQEVGYFDPASGELADLRRVCERFPMKITPYYAGLMDRDDPRDPLRLMAVPAVEELSIRRCELADPIGDASRTLRTRPAAAVTHRYPDRVLLHCTPLCGGYCRHCFRRRIAERGACRPGSAEMEAALEYIGGRKDVREVILSGGDPLMEPDESLLAALEALKGLNGIRSIRIHTRMPVWNPYRITDELASALRRFNPLWIVTHFNHPREVTELAAERLARLVDRGIMVLNQSVLLKGVNDSAAVQRELLWALLRARVKPYYLHHLDMARGVFHFRVGLQRGIDIMRELRGTIPGYAIPHYVLDIPGGHGKVPLEYRYVRGGEDGSLLVESKDGEMMPSHAGADERAAALEVNASSK